MYNKLNLLMLIAFFIFTSCNSQNQSFEDKALKDYQYAISFFPKEAVAHFPAKIDSNSYSMSSNIPQNTTKFKLGNNPIMFNYICLYNNKEHYDKIKNGITSKKYKCLSPNDSTIFLVFSYLESEGHKNVEIIGYELEDDAKRIIELNKKNQNNIPIPLFDNRETLDSTTFTRLDKDFRIYHISAKSGEFIKKDYLSNSYYFPDKWKHGFSRGYCLNDKKQMIIYWAIVW